MTKPKRKRQKPQPFDFFAVPLKDATVGLGQLIGEGPYGEDVYALYRTRARSVEALRTQLDSTGGDDVVGVITVGTLELRRGDWLILGSQESDRRGYLSGLPVPP